jgi:NADPH:quinone reductase-like Zn-dependent oxidoreductase
MRAIEAETFSGYGGLRQVELPKPQPAKDRVLGPVYNHRVQRTAATRLIIAAKQVSVFS